VVESENLTSEKILALRPLIERLSMHRAAGKRIVFTNGCFDILHAGHVHYLAVAKAEGDILVIGLNSDVSVQNIKGTQRPIIPEGQRAFVLASLEYVDYVAIFNEPDPYHLIQAIMPDVLVKGADWKESEIIGADIVKKHSGRVVRVKMMSGVSTSKIIEKIVRTSTNHPK
jgi:D-beta-D-heptose 7-phosphate kinase/D-beta-D-heptose 1-phosphate adenosyltransferase